MPFKAVVGAQWGDEGKGKIIDYLAAQAALVIRYQGGANAGHTVVNEFGEFKLHLVPSGICFPGVDCLIGPGVVVEPGALLEEVAALEQAGIRTDRLWLAERAHLVMPWHVLLDRLEEEARGGRRIGTTGRGIGPAYAAKAARRGLQVADLADRDWLARRVADALAEVNPVLRGAYGHPGLDAADVVEQYWGFGRALGDRVIDSLPLVRRALTRDLPALLEGQLGVLRDLDWGTYPFVTSSSPLAGGAAAGAGVPPWAIQTVVGVCKAYTTAVGEGPFPTEDTGPLADELRRRGREFGATTGRPRRCGWFDGVAARYAVEVGGVTRLALTKLDVLDEFPVVKVCTGYRIGGQTVGTVPPLRLLQGAEPVFEELPGWQVPTTGARRWEDLPSRAQALVRRIAALAGAPVSLVSVGAERSATFSLPPAGQGRRPG